MIQELRFARRVLWTLRERPIQEARAMLDSLEQREQRLPMSAVPLIYAYVGVGDTARAIAQFSRAIEARDWDLYPIVLRDPMLAMLHGTPAYRKALELFGLKEGGVAP